MTIRMTKSAWEWTSVVRAHGIDRPHLDKARHKSRTDAGGYGRAKAE